MLTVIVLSFMKGENSVGQMVYSIAAQIVFGVLIGFLIALGAVWFMKHFTFNTSGFDAAFVLGVGGACVRIADIGRRKRLSQCVHSRYRFGKSEHT